MAQKSSKGSEEPKLISKYRELNQIEIPKKPIITGVIHPKLYYVVWEENLLKPKILKYSFASHFFANGYAKSKLKGYRYNVLSGETLIEFGIDYADLKLRDATGEKNTRGVKYNFHPQLSQQRKKTLRNLYRRNQRRLLKKLLLLKK